MIPFFVELKKGIVFARGFKNVNVYDGPLSSTRRLIGT
jgi:hypothetical protein